MAIEASFTAEEGEFPLAEVFSKFPASRIELERVIPTNDALVPYFWLQDVDAAAIDLEGVDHPGINDLQIIDALETEVFVRIDWDFDYESVLTAIFETDIALVSAVGTHEKWTFDVRATEQAAVSEFQSYCRECGIPIELVQLHALSPLHSGSEYDLTDAQREALVLAYSHGYYDSPRTASQDDIAAELEITRQAVASRLQRGTRNLIASTLIGATD
ncbi:helix-turn-helix domain-containing protein [Natronolimnobius baerhuensis]|uniref:Bacterio-opsin activator n=1 Tax=Natronolimnobius baerhuensis TaxID=253108 RepID=A0A202EDA6_9EURY|nr:helix-turn-helix domain-containing protein [Natronolimnobius baerhuensis]OVE86222.1 bacterio-opsin activator [Natronolimnobius baerhuensis]